MHRAGSWLLVLILILVVIDFMGYLALRHIISGSYLQRKWTNVDSLIYIFFWIMSILIYAGVVVLLFLYSNRYITDSRIFYLLNTVIVVKYVPQLIFCLGFIVDYLFFVPVYVFAHYDIRRNMLITRFMGIIGALLCGSYIWGILKGRNSVRVRYLTLYFDNLPEGFEGTSIAFFSDLHAGSYDRFSWDGFVSLIRMLKSLNAEIIIFGGDWINYRAEELVDFYEFLRDCEAPLGKFSVLGNHDYGEYYPWSSPLEKRENMRKLKNFIEGMGFLSLDNSSVIITKGNESIAICGCEYWGRSLQEKRGDIDKAVSGVSDVPFKILITHDPSHYTDLIEGKYDIALVLSGHTHGFQMGFNFDGFKWSPVKYSYKHWAGLYKTSSGYHYVSTGVGTVGYMGRVGFLPEVVLIILRKKSGTEKAT